MVHISWLWRRWRLLFGVIQSVLISRGAATATTENGYFTSDYLRFVGPSLPKMGHRSSKTASLSMRCSSSPLKSMPTRTAWAHVLERTGNTSGYHTRKLGRELLRSEVLWHTLALMPMGVLVFMEQTLQNGCLPCKHAIG